VIWLLWTIPIKLILPSIAFLFVMWFACWWVGRIPFTASSTGTARGWLTACAIGVFGAWGAFQYLAPATEGKIKREFERRLTELQKGKGLDGVPAAVADANNHDLENELPWEQFTIARLKEETAQN
jgi:hypothetical protein